MKKIYLPVFIAFLFSNCQTTSIPFKNEYHEGPYTFTVQSPRDFVWSQMIDLLVANGIAVKTLDRNEGLITSDIISFMRSYTWEKNNGELHNPSALVVCGKNKGWYNVNSMNKPKLVQGQWTVLLKDDRQGTIVQIMLSNPKAQLVYEPASSNNSRSPDEMFELAVQSTGVFETSMKNKLLSIRGVSSNSN